MPDQNRRGAVRAYSPFCDDPKVTKLGEQLISVGGGVRYWADSPDSGPEGVGFRLVVTLLFPK